MTILERLKAAAWKPINDSVYQDRVIDILKKLETAKCPDRKLDAAIEEIAGDWYYPDGVTKTANRYTASIDAALALVAKKLPGWKLTMDDIRPDEGTATDTYLLGPNYNDMTSADSSKPVGTRPICLAILEALFTALTAKEEQS